MLPKLWQNVRRVLAVRLDNIGDVIMLGPALRTLKKTLPEIHLTLMCSPAGSQAAPLLPWIDEVVVYRPVWQDISQSKSIEPQREQSLIETLRQRNFDAALIFTSFSQSPHPPAMICYFAGIPIRVGQSKEFGGKILSDAVKSIPDEIHQVERNLFLLESIGIYPSDDHIELHVSEEIQQKTDRLLQAAGLDPYSPFIVVAPGASCSARQYEIKRLSAAVSELRRKTTLPIVVVGSRKERELESPLLETGGSSKIVSLVGKTSVPELAAVIRRCSVVVSNNSSPLHIADAFEKPIVVLYSGTDFEEQWRPRSSSTTLLRQETHCSPCYEFCCPYQRECLDIAPEEVVQSVLEKLPRESAPSRAMCLGRGK